MKFYSGSYFCSKSNWNDGIYDSNNLVSISRYEDIRAIYSRKQTRDFKTLFNIKKVFDAEKYEGFKEFIKSNKDAENFKTVCQKDCAYLRQYVLTWLHKNVKDTKDGKKGWCYGNENYRISETLEVSIFFYRRKDALLFIKTFSMYKKPTETYSQNTYVKKKLDFKTNKLVIDEN